MCLLSFQDQLFQPGQLFMLNCLLHGDTRLYIQFIMPKMLPIITNGSDV